MTTETTLRLTRQVAGNAAEVLTTGPPRVCRTHMVLLAGRALAAGNWQVLGLNRHGMTLIRTADDLRLHYRLRRAESDD